MKNLKNLLIVLAILLGMTTAAMANGMIVIKQGEKVTVYTDYSNGTIGEYKTSSTINALINAGVPEDALSEFSEFDAIWSSDTYCIKKEFAEKEAELNSNINSLNNEVEDLEDTKNGFIWTVVIMAIIIIALLVTYLARASELKGDRNRYKNAYDDEAKRSAGLATKLNDLSIIKGLQVQIQNLEEELRLAKGGEEVVLPEAQQ